MPSLKVPALLGRPLSEGQANRVTGRAREELIKCSYSGHGEENFFSAQNANLAIGNRRGQKKTPRRRGRLNATRGGKPFGKKNPPRRRSTVSRGEARGGQDRRRADRPTHKTGYLPRGEEPGAIKKDGPAMDCEVNADKSLNKGLISEDRNARLLCFVQYPVLVQVVCMGFISGGNRFWCLQRARGFSPRATR